MAAMRVFGAFLLFVSFYLQTKSQNFENCISKDDPKIKEWASGCKVKRGYINISDTSQTYSAGGITSNRATFGADSLALGKADGVDKVVSLGDGGTAVLTFPHPIKNGIGTDFAVFENGIESATQLGYYFLEPAFVEVSSDGINFFRFPSQSKTQTISQTGAFESLNPNDLYDLAGNRPLNFGTTFDLEELKGISGLDVNKITAVKIIDIPGSISSEFAQYDSFGNIINAPFPTPFNTCGFDLNAVGVMNQNDDSEIQKNEISVKIFPIPAKSSDKLTIEIQSENYVFVQIDDISGNTVYQNNLSKIKSYLQIPNLQRGIYFLKVTSGKAVQKNKFIIL
jgi:hypothetical protein